MLFGLANVQSQTVIIVSGEKRKRAMVPPPLCTVVTPYTVTVEVLSANQTFARPNIMVVRQ